MSETNQTPAAVEPAAAAGDDFDKQLNEFLNYSMMGDEPAPEDAISQEPVVNTPVPVAAPVPAPAPVPATVEPTSVPQGTVADATIEAGKVVAADPNKVDPADIIEMLGFGKGTTAAPPSGDVTKAAPVSTPAAPNDEPFVPFNTDWKLPAAMTAALFEAEDSETRGKALVGLISGAMNTLAQVVDQRIKEFHAPRIVEGWNGQQQAARTQAEFVEDFYSENGGYPDLRPYGQIVRRAIEVTVGKNPTATWAGSKADVAKLARAVVQQMTGQPAPVATKAAPAPLPPAKAQDQAFIADGARPAGAGNPTDPNSPESLLHDMANF